MRLHPALPAAWGCGRDGKWGHTGGREMFAFCQPSPGSVLAAGVPASPFADEESSRRPRRQVGAPQGKVPWGWGVFRISPGEIKGKQSCPGSSHPGSRPEAESLRPSGEICPFLDFPELHGLKYSIPASDHVQNCASPFGAGDRGRL